MTAVLLAAVLAQGPADAAEVYAELGRDRFVGPRVMVPAAYRADAVTVDDVRANPAKYPVRAAVLGAADALRKSAKLMPPSELHHTQTSDKGKTALVDVQEDLAGAILLLEESADALVQAEKRLAGETSKRWQAHHAYLSGAVAARIAYLEELNLAYGMVRAGRLPARDEAKGETGWRLVPAEKLMSKAAVRKLSEAARERFTAVAKAHPNTPWAALAEADLAAKPGLAWEPATVKQPEPAKKPGKKK